MNYHRDCLLGEYTPTSNDGCILTGRSINYMVVFWGVLTYENSLKKFTLKLCFSSNLVANGSKSWETIHGMMAVTESLTSRVLVPLVAIRCECRPVRYSKIWNADIWIGIMIAKLQRISRQ